MLRGQAKQRQQAEVTAWHMATSPGAVETQGTVETQGKVEMREGFWVQ